MGTWSWCHARPIKIRAIWEERFLGRIPQRAQDRYNFQLFLLPTFGISIFLFINVSLRFESLTRFETFESLCSSKSFDLNDTDACQQCKNNLLLEVKCVSGPANGPVLPKLRSTELIQTIPSPSLINKLSFIKCSQVIEFMSIASLG